MVGFAKQSGGGTGIETRVGKGTSVRVFLPRSKDARVDHDLFSIARLGSGTEATAPILVVDDDAAVLKTTVRLLDALGYSVVPALNGEEALRLIDSHSEIDLILADYAMLAMSGVEFAKMIETARPGVAGDPRYRLWQSRRYRGFQRNTNTAEAEDELILRIRRALNER